METATTQHSLRARALQPKPLDHPQSRQEWRAHPSTTPTLLVVPTPTKQRARAPRCGHRAGTLWRCWM
eukprot:9260719-Prorocentrum_lima.AAC.1